MVDRLKKSQHRPARDSARDGGDIRVLVVEDSATQRHYLTTLINETPGLRVVGAARDGEEAVTLVQELSPDVVSMDIQMPHLNGLEATRRIMSRCPTPVVVVSSLVEREIDIAFQAIEAGALAVVEKPPARTDATFAEKQHRLMTMLQAMAQVRVVRHWERPSADGKPPITGKLRPKPEVIAIGASAGGPSALGTVLNGLPGDLPVPIVVVQHMPDEFIAGFARWLDNLTPLHVVVAADGMTLEPGVVHLAPGTAHVTLVKRNGKLVIRLVEERGEYRHQPSVDVLFESIASVCGDSSLGIILTGMGDDGAAGLLAMRQAGARTYVQDEATSTVFGMPAAAIERGAAERVLPLAQFSTAVLNLM